MVAKGYKRSRILIDARFQWSFAIRITVFTWGVMLLTAALYSVLYSLMRGQVSQPDPFADQSVVTFYNLPNIMTFVNGNGGMILLGVGMITVVSLLFGLLVSFRLAGPVFRMRWVLAEMSKGHLSGDTIRLRNGDELQSLYDDICLVRSHWKTALAGMQQLCQGGGSAAEQLAQVHAQLLKFDIGDDGQRGKTGG
ncbi:MAG: hypothetical protein Q9M26_05560 [Mariprofundales bacterium]|nr:hypothetical protein [Mariprofundales bacterium]